MPEMTRRIARFADVIGLDLDRDMTREHGNSRAARAELEL
jgi:hypothetical protein